MNAVTSKNYKYPFNCWSVESNATGNILYWVTHFMLGYTKSQIPEEQIYNIPLLIF